jgi:hypothetical protein
MHNRNRPPLNETKLGPIHLVFEGKEETVKKELIKGAFEHVYAHAESKLFGIKEREIITHFEWMHPRGLAEQYGVRARECSL